MNCDRYISGYNAANNTSNSVLLGDDYANNDNS